LKEFLGNICFWYHTFFSKQFN